MYAHVYLGGDCIYSNKIENKAAGVNPAAQKTRDLHLELWVTLQSPRPLGIGLISELTPL